MGDTFDMHMELGYSGGKKKADIVERAVCLRPPIKYS
jgi:hypothetical protein